MIQNKSFYVHLIVWKIEGIANESSLSFPHEIMLLTNFEFRRCTFTHVDYASQ